MPDNQNPHTSVLEEKGNVVWGIERGSRTAAWHGRCRGVAFPLLAVGATRGFEWGKQFRHLEQCFKKLNLLVVGYVKGESWG